MSNSSYLHYALPRPSNCPTWCLLFMCLFIISRRHGLTVLSLTPIRKEAGLFIKLFQMAFALLIFHLFRGRAPHPPHPPSLQGIITINQDACFFITSYNGYCMFGTYWLAFGSTYTFISHTAAYLAVFNICLSQAEWNTRWYLELKWAGLPASDSETPGQQSNLIVSWQQYYPT